MLALDVARTFAELGLSVLERGWLSSNNIVFAAGRDAPATVVDTGYVAHAGQTCELVARALGAGPVERVLNTHLHSDHCGGNAALQARWDCEVWVPEPSFDAVTRWDAGRLTFEATDQRCERFTAQQSLRASDRVRLGEAWWNIVAAPGHDPEAVMLFEPGSGAIITADALWEQRVAINFPELDGEPGFAAALSALDSIERLQPRICIPGHGAPFTEIGAAIERSRQRLAQFAADPAKHLAYAERALTMFHMLERRSRSQVELIDWLRRAPIFQTALRRFGLDPEEHSPRVVERLVQDGLLRRDADGQLTVARD